MLEILAVSKGMEASSKPEAAFSLSQLEANMKLTKKKVSQPNARKDNFQISWPGFL